MLALPSEALAEEGCWLLVAGSASFALRSFSEEVSCKSFLCANLRFFSAQICEKLPLLRLYSFTPLYALTPANIMLRLKLFLTCH
jgi:hypothetical protein